MQVVALALANIVAVSMVIFTSMVLADARPVQGSAECEVVQQAYLNSEVTTVSNYVPVADRMAAMCKVF